MRVRDRREAILSVGWSRWQPICLMTIAREGCTSVSPNDPPRNVYEHKRRLMPSFTSKYCLERPVYFKDTD